MTMRKNINILLVDDHLLIRQGIKLLLKSSSNIKIVGECSNGIQALKYLEENTNPDVILMDINMPEMNGIEATRIISKKYPNTNVLALTMHSELENIVNMIDAGAKGYILKDNQASEIEIAIKTVADSKPYYSNEVSKVMINSLLINNTTSNSTELSDRELEILSLIVNGNSNGEIGNKLKISSRTVETHKRNILRKLNLRNTAEMIKYALENNMVKS